MEQLRELISHLTEALVIYDTLIEAENGPIAKGNWQIDRDNIEAAIVYARSQRS